jgi:hypothetical protein
MRKLVFLLPVLIVLVSGCVNISPEDLARASPVVRQFLEEHPNAKIVATHFTQSQAESMLDVIKQDCDNPYLEPKEFYRFTVEDNETGFKAVVWIDWENQIVECAYKEGYLGKREYGDKEVDPNRCVSRHIRKCYDKNAYWFDSCGNKQEKAELCNYGCAEGRCVQSECRSNAQAKCYGRHVYWFDSCGHVQEKKEYCEYGCERGFCKERPAEKSCQEAGGYCTYPTYGCPEDAKVCPDGTVVTRVGPDCEFKSCPVTANCAMVCPDGSAVECKTVNNYCVCDSCPTASTDTVTGMVYDTGETPVSSGGGGGGSSAIIPTTSTSYCDEYYVCPNGEKVRHCEMVKTEIPGTCVVDESGVEVCSASGASVGCVCRENPEEACPSVSSHLSCREGYKLTDDYWCPEDGVCCLPETPEPECFDSDGGKDYHTAGVVETHIQRLEDHCNNDGTLTEKYCTDSGEAKAETVECPDGYVCEEGACVTENQTDPCEGVTCPGGCYNESDRKYDGTCVEGDCVYEYETCPNGCLEGACITENQTECAEEGELTSGAVAPEYYYGCCEGLESINPYPEDWVGGGMLCYDSEKGTPVCLGNGTSDEGWFYPDETLLMLTNCTETNSTSA